MNKQEIEKATECCERYKGVAETYGSKKSAKEDKRLIDLAISALEKQIPKEPTDADFTERCQNCKKPVSIMYDYVVCGSCGQRLNWGE